MAVSGFNVSAYTDEDGIVHVTVTRDGRAWEAQGHPVVTIEQTLAPVDAKLGAPYRVVTPEHFRLELSPARTAVRSAPTRRKVEG